MWMIPKTKSSSHNMKTKNTTFKVSGLGGGQDLQGFPLLKLPTAAHPQATLMSMQNQLRIF